MALTPTEQALILALAPRFVPAISSLPPEDTAHLLALIEQALNERPPAVRRQFSLLLAVLRWSPVVRFGRPLDRLDPARQDAVLHWFQDVPVLKVRAGFWGLRTLIYLGYYGRPQVADAIGYRPSRDGNALLHARTSR